MFTRLIESRRASERTAGGTAASIFAHAAVIGGVALATLGAATGRHEPVATQMVIYTPVDPTTPRHTPAAPHAPPSRCVDCLPLHAPVTTTPVITGNDASPEAPPIDFVVGTPGGESAAPGTGEAGCADCVYETADELAHPFGGNAPPIYPPALRNMRITGSVVARFVVDTAGRVEPASVQFESGGDELFESAARRALVTWRFQPAATNGHRVRILVRQEFSFRLTP